MPTSQTQIHRPHRILRYINIVIGIALLAAAGTVYWFVYRVLPQTSGTIAAPVSQRVTIARDALGVPHISAASEDDAFFAQGYVTAQDRLFQMDGLRRLAGGDLAEIAGRGLWNSTAIRAGCACGASRNWLTASLPTARPRAAGGLRARRELLHQTHLHALPVEFTLLGYSRGRGAWWIRF
jgi:penicillin G amidase